MQLPRGLARFNRRITNPIQGVWAPRLAPWAVIGHTGRRSGRSYETPVIAARVRNQLAIPILYGEESDWVRNLLASGTGTVTRRGRTERLSNPRIVPREQAPGGLLVRPAATVLVADIGPIG